MVPWFDDAGSVALAVRLSLNREASPDAMRRAEEIAIATIAISINVRARLLSVSIPCQSTVGKSYFLNG